MVSVSGKIFLAIMGIIIFMNIVGKLVPINHESLFVVLFVMGIVIWYQHRDTKIDYRILIWVGIVVFYWLVTLTTLILHGDLGDRAVEQLNITHSFLGFMMVSVILFYLKPTIDIFWCLIGVAAISVVILLFMEVLTMGWGNFLDGKRLGIYLHAVKMGVFSNTIFIIMLGSLVWAYNKGVKFFFVWILLLLMVFLTVVFSQTRQAWLGWPESILAWSIYYFILFKGKSKIKVKGLLISVLIITLFAILLIKSPAVTVFEKRINQTFTSLQVYWDRESFKTSLGNRLIGFEASMTGISNNFWIGIGDNHFREFQTTQTATVALEKFNQDYTGINYRHIHNQYIMSFLTRGIFGFIGILLILGFLYWFFIRGLKQADMKDKPIWIAGLVFTIAESLTFVADSPFVRSDTVAHFFVFANLLIGFAILSEVKKRHN